jgi:hypothetical protein
MYASSVALLTRCLFLAASACTGEGGFGLALSALGGLAGNGLGGGDLGGDGLALGALGGLAGNGLGGFGLDGDGLGGFGLGGDLRRLGPCVTRLSIPRVVISLPFLGDSVPCLASLA